MLRPSMDLVFPVASLLCAAGSAVYDVASRRIPNFLTLPALACGLVLHAFLGGWRQAATAALGALLCGFVFLVFYLAGGMGAGDVKLIAAVGCLAGFSRIAPLLVFTGLAGGVMALGLALARGQLTTTLQNMFALAMHHRTMGLAPHPEFNVGNEQTLRLPYALAITAGCALNLSLQLLEVRQ
jgi:prepilin peptidase CpaA